MQLQRNFSQKDKKQNQTKYKSLNFFLSSFATYNISNFLLGYFLAYFNTIDYMILHEELNFFLEPGLSEGLITGAIPLGAVFGCLLLSFIVEKISRKHVFYIQNLIAFIGVILTLFPNMPLIFIGRLFEGILAGVATGNVSIMMKQLSPSKLQNLSGVFVAFSLNFGIFFAFFLTKILSMFMKYEQLWIFVFAFPLILIILQQILLMFVFTNQTPKYLLLNNREQQFEELIAKIYKQEYRQQITNDISKQIGVQNEQRQNELNQQYSEKRKDSPKAIVLAFWILMMQQLCGYPVLSIYIEGIISNYLPSLKTEIPVVLHGIKTFICLFSFYITKRFRVCDIIIYGYILIAAVHTLLALAFYLLPQQKNVYQKIYITMLLFAFTFIFILTISSASRTYVPLIVQPKIVSYASLAYWATSWILFTLIPVLRPICVNQNCPSIYIFFALCLLFSLYLCKRIMVDFTGKTEQEIQEQFDNKKFCC